MNGVLVILSFRNRLRCRTKCALRTCARYDAVEVATDKITEHDGEVKAEDFAKVGKKEIGGDGEVIERICHAVGKTTDDEEGYTEEGGEDIALARKGYGSGHDESATDSEESATQRTYGKATFKNGLGGFLKWVGRGARQKCYEQATEDVAKEHENEVGHFVALDEARKTGVEAKTIIDYR